MSATPLDCGVIAGVDTDFINEGIVNEIIMDPTGIISLPIQ